MDGLQASPHGGREVRSYTANRRELRFGVVAASVASGGFPTTVQVHSVRLRVVWRTLRWIESVWDFLWHHHARIMQGE